MLRGLVEHFAKSPQEIPDVLEGLATPSTEAEMLHQAVAYVAGMTDRYACRQAVTLLNWPIDQLPRGIDR